MCESFVPSVMLAETYDIESPLIGTMLASEKLDGVRAVWKDCKLWTRNGKVIDAPERLLDELPSNVDLDGELWLGRGRFDECSGRVRRKRPDHTHREPLGPDFKKWLDGWEGIQYHVFDVYGVHEPFRDRLELIHNLHRRQYLSEDNRTLRPHLWRPVEHRRVQCQDEIMSFSNEVLNAGGEGLILRDPTATYVHGRSKAMLKFKPFRDLDAEVIGHEEGEGRNAGRVGALVCKIVAGGKKVTVGTEFRCGSGLSDANRNDPPAIGSRVIVRYQELTKAGVPRFPRFVGVRAD